jgi:catechol-2,3-dioxygenase
VNPDDRIELDEPTSVPPRAADRRPVMPEPLPVRLVAVADVVLPAPAGVEVQLDAFYEDVLGFVRYDDPHRLVYHADNFDLAFEVSDRPVRHDKLRPLGVIVPLLADVVARLVERQIEYSYQRGINPGAESLVLLDPAGNWVEMTDTRGVW